MSEPAPRRDALDAAARKAELRDDPLYEVLALLADATDRLEAIGRQPLSPAVMRAALRSAMLAERWYPVLVAAGVGLVLGLVLGAGGGWLYGHVPWQCMGHT